MAPSPALAGIVRSIADWDMAGTQGQPTLGINVLPSIYPYLIIQYRPAFESVRQFARVNYPHAGYRHVATKVHSGIVTLRLDRAVGAIVVRLEAEAAARLIGERMHDFLDAKIALEDVFDPVEVSLLEEMVAEAKDGAVRFAAVERFLLANLSTREPDPVVCRAAALLRRRPSLRVHRLAEQLDVSERHLSRSFHAMFGTPPKHFARIARIEKAFVERTAGSAWADVAYACGFADQAHMINDFNEIVGAPPEEVMRPEFIAQRGDLAFFTC